MSDIFDEVSEDLRAERTRKLLRRYAGPLIAAGVLVVAGAGGWQAWKYYEAREAAHVGQSFLAAMRIADGPAGADRQAALAGFAQVAREGSPGYRTLARLRAAAVKADAGDRDGALALWDQVAGDNSADKLLRDLARLQWALHQIDAGDPAAVEQHLAPLTTPGNPWHALAEEAQALLALRQGNNDAARDTLKRLAQDVTAPDGVRGRANGLLARLGG
ncbi:tetratricopeptide repeat protein [Limobrevibacterium gyesilva]|uniref:Tetratricopeptide repeat protein n=1 Tax=Limobrevibacterium gyesilva TaxID=2991712 RepID=A0AA41YQU0_9PROT|nr:tetratricopeptide repeat protein [Limobrevibacterium gyesilva]